jgi:hypothetical protein
MASKKGQFDRPEHMLLPMQSVKATCPLCKGVSQLDHWGQWSKWMRSTCLECGTIWLNREDARIGEAVGVDLSTLG